MIYQGRVNAVRDVWEDRPRLLSDEFPCESESLSRAKGRAPPQGLRQRSSSEALQVLITCKAEVQGP